MLLPVEVPARQGFPLAQVVEDFGRGEVTAPGVEDAAGQRTTISAWPERLNAESRRLGDRVLIENIEVRPALDPEEEELGQR